MKLPSKNELKEEREKSLCLLEGYQVTLQVLEAKALSKDFTAAIFNLELAAVNDRIIYLREQLGENFEEKET